MAADRSQTANLEARLRAKYPNDALQRLVHAEYEYYSTHGDYLPELAKLLLIERARLQAAEAERDKYRMEADCAIRDCDAFDLDLGVARELLQKFADQHLHLEGCAARKTVWRTAEGPPQCDCGLVAALGSVGTEPQTELGGTAPGAAQCPVVVPTKEGKR